MTFEEALAQQPQWVQLWTNFMGIVILVVFVVLLFSRTTRRDALIIFLVNLSVYFTMMWMYGELGYVRLLGLPHVILWTPLCLYLLRRLSNPYIRAPFRQAIWLLLLVMVISLGFDYADVVRYLLGEQAQLATTVPA
jgi:hypothetical protein